MPLYDFYCVGCGLYFEVHLLHFDDDDPKCPECGEKLERQMPAVWFKIN